MANANRVSPYPKRLTSLIAEYQSTTDPQVKTRCFHKILMLIDKLMIRIIQQIYKYESYSYLRYRKPNEIYHTAIIALGKSISKLKLDDSFTINSFASRLSGYIGREFKIQFSRDIRYVGFEDLGPEVESSITGREEKTSVDGIIERIKEVKPDFPDDGIRALKMVILEDRSYQEVAELLQVRRGSIRLWIDRGKKILRKIIEKERNENLWLS